ncbi:hypothetical protein D3C72_1816230 [compost metagenome]
MAGDPAHVGGTPEHFALAIIEHSLEGHGCLQQVAGGGVQHAFGFASTARGVEDEQRIFGLHRLRRAISTHLSNRLVVPEVTPLMPVNRAASALDHHHRADIRATAQGLVDVFLQGNGLGAA